MVDLVLRSDKGSALTHEELDGNQAALNLGKAEILSAVPMTRAATDTIIVGGCLYEWVPDDPLVPDGSGSYAQRSTRVLFSTDIPTMDEGPIFVRGRGTYRWNGSAYVPGPEYQRRNILGHVGIADGIPQGAIIERGSNASGQYTKFADGSLECWRANILLQFSSANRLDAIWAFPAAAYTGAAIAVLLSWTWSSQGHTPKTLQSSLAAEDVTGTQARLSFFTDGGFVSGSQASVAAHLKARWTA